MFHKRYRRDLQQIHKLPLVWSQLIESGNFACFSQLKCHFSCTFYQLLNVPAHSVSVMLQRCLKCLYCWRYWLNVDRFLVIFSGNTTESQSEICRFFQTIFWFAWIPPTEIYFKTSEVFAWSQGNKWLYLQKLHPKSIQTNPVFPRSVWRWINLETINKLPQLHALNIVLWILLTCKYYSSWGPHADFDVFKFLHQ